MKKLLLVLTALGLMANFTACTANQTQDDTEFVENADVDKIEADEPLLDDGMGPVTDQEAESLSENLTLDNSLESALGEDSGTSVAANESENLSLDNPPADTLSDMPQDDLAAAPSLDESSIEAPPSDIPADTVPADSLASNDMPPEDSSLSLDPPATDVTDSQIIDPPATDIAAMDTPAADTPTEAPPADTTTSLAEPIEATPVTPVAATTSEKKPVSNLSALKKVSEATPYAFGDGFVNTIYIARPKESLKDISQTIYGMDKTKDLKKINTFLRARKPRAGDKIAYVSPNRPTDSTRTISFYEDTGMVPETYVAQKNENLRKVAKDLLGYSDAWKEIWTTNSISSKYKLAEGDTLKYWKSPSAISTTQTTLAKNEMPQSQQEAVNNIINNNTAPAMDPAMNAAVPPPPPSMQELPPPPAQADLPPPPPADAMAANTMPPQESFEAPPPPPPSMEDQFAAQPPPPPPADDMGADKSPANAEGDEFAEASTNDDMMTMMGIAVLLFGALAFVLVKRKKAKAAEMAMEEHLGT